MDPSKKELYTAKRTTNLDLSDNELTVNYNNIRNSDIINWFITYIQSPNKVLIKSSGSNGLDGLLASLSNDDIYYGLIKASIAGMIKFYHIYFVGSDVNGMKKGKGSLYKSGVFSSFEAHGEIVMTNGLEDATREKIIEQIVKLARVKPEDIII